jgi:G3E family GTPase
MFTLISPKISAIPTTLITGFLGVGKTTAILYLLANKPKHENWAVLVNEFGEVGIDSALFNGTLSRTSKKDDSHEKGVFIREVSGGCMCCASGVPMQVALNQLITKSKPDRIIIEPTGLGHPKEVVKVLTSGKYREIINLQSILCLVDARNLCDTRYVEHPSFLQQLKIADIILAAKADTYSAQDKVQLSHFITDNNLTEKTLHQIQQGNINPSWLEQVRKTNISAKPTIGIANSPLQGSLDKNDKDYKSKRNQDLQTKLDQDGFIELNNQGEGYFSKGWIFSKNHTFDHQRLITLITSLNIVRAKGVVLTEKGSYSFNKAGSEFNCNKVSRSKDSRIELIDINEATLSNVTCEQLLMLKSHVL